MTDVNCLTSEQTTTRTTTTTPTTTTTTAEEATNYTTPTKNVLEQPPTSPFILRAPPSAKSKLILQNMEEVLNTVKQKHREKHKRKREEKRRAALLAEQATAIEATNAAAVPAVTATTTTTTPNGRHVLREKTARENGLSQAKRKSNGSPVKSSTPQSSIMKAEPAGKTPAKATNVFELMMNARNRSMGTNANGQELAEAVEPIVTPHSKRKQMLQEWNDRKGGAKRRLADEARGDYIEQKMEQRAKRLKKMLTQPNEPRERKQSNSSSQELPRVRKQTSSSQETKETISSQEAQSDSKQTQAQAASAPTKRMRGRPRTRRLSADVETALPVSADPDTLQFLSKLSSPTKKRDSLLGYFTKVESPQNSAEREKGKPEIKLIEEAIETPKRRPRASKTSSNLSVNVEETSATTTPSGRPRRSCAAKARYDYDLEVSPTKAVKPSPAVEENDCIEIIDLDNSNPAVTPKKLAPLFVRQVPKPSPDPTALRARQEFLHSGVPEKLKQEQQRQRSYEQYYEDSYELFPSIAHVGSERLEVKQASKRLPLRAEEQQEEDAATIARKPRPGSITSCTASDFVASRKRTPCSWTPLPQLDNKRAMVKNWKSIFDRFPTFKCYNQMREKYRHFSAIDAAQDTQPMGESFVMTRRTRRSIQQQDVGKEEDFHPPALAPNGELLFTEKYKPLLFEQVLVNLTPVQELRDFLANWSGASASNRNSQTLDDSSNDHDSSSMSGSCNTMVLLGPCSSGKTNAVFALANDMNFNVLEINAGMRRTGKKLIQELQEATQSHQIRKEAKAGAAPTQQLLQKLQQNGLKARRNQGDDDVRKSLILIEDADIVFDNIDAGFTDAIYTLAASSKRPVIIVASDPNCAHLQRLMQQNTIKFQAPNALNISRFLAVLALMENCPIELDELISLYLFNNQNLRKTLMELQFFIQSGGDAKREQVAVAVPSGSPSKSPRLATLPGVQIHQRLFEFYTSAQNVQHLIPFPVDFRLLRLNLGELLRHSTQLQSPSTPVARRVGKRKSCSPKKAWLNKSEAQEPLQTLASFYEQLSTATLLDATLEERNDRLQPHLSEQLAHELVERAVGTCLAAKNYAYNLFDKPEQRFNLSDQLGSFQLRSSCARSLDYEPAMRSICRSEKQRASLERRSSRFYHYLRNHTNHNLSSFSLELYDAACQVLQEQAPLVE
ncbi:ATPase family AAA domain-containing protein 5 isoform X2 [Drosophila mojavensis]|uniref:ATPase family AAA domain-containing protein 5 isoform X2 n=1 Tax=Drosophila mojavensis TaxID=7230 RepID=UPI001CD0BB5A|nr:ATPase family AAA domain-containing protein 5 isoform X2 [Drosophila mojavensis]